ncbi:hypothetical protein HanIR_Chr01g0015211 [Helianthus annuus]|nr:hypothetical protein HanIR_Chr01g0015211 [Helianthus annuus]
MTPPKGVSKWKTKFFYVKACAVHAHMTFRNVNVGVTNEDIPVATAKTVEWFSRLRPIELKKLDNNQLWVLRMMLSRPDRRARPVLREKSGEKAVGLWRMFEPDFEGRVDLVACGQLEGFNLEIVGNFRVPTREILNAPVRGNKGTLGDLGKFKVKVGPKKHVERKQVKKPARGRGKEKTEGSTAPPLVSQAAGFGCSRCGAAIGGTAAGSTVAGEKRKPEQAAAGGGELKRRKLQSKRTGPTQKKPAVTAEQQDAGFSFFDAPLSPSHTTAADAGVPKEPAAPFVKVVPDPTVQAERTAEKVATQIFDTVDSSNNLISPNNGDNLDLRFSDAGKQKSDAEPQKSPAGEKVTGSSSGGAGYDGPPIQPWESELEYYYRTYTPDRGTSYHRPPWTVMQGGDISNDHLHARRFWVVWAPHLKLIVPEEAARLRAEAEELVKAARAGAEQLERDRAAFEKQKQTAEWAATAELKQVHTLAKLLSDERKSWNEKLSNERKTWKESWAKQNENPFRARQELANLRAANAYLAKEKAVAEAAVGRAKEDEARTAKALEEAKNAGARFANALNEANADCTRLNQTVTREVKVADLTARVTVAEKRANEVVEARDALTSSFNQLEADCEWMRSRGIAHVSITCLLYQMFSDDLIILVLQIVQSIMDAPETATGLDLVKQRARDAGFKAGYSRCISHINVMSKGGYTEERSGFRDVDTEALLDAVVASFYDTPLSCVEKLNECLEAADYVDRLRMLYADAEEENTAGGGQDGAGTSGTK